MKYLISIFLFFLIYGELVTAEIDFNTGTGLMLGTGYDTSIGDTRGDCITYQAVRNGGAPLARRSYTIRLIENRGQLASYLGVEVGAAVRGAIGSASGKANFVASYSMNDFSLFVLVQARILNSIEKISNPVIKEDYLNLAKINPEQFRDACGNRFVASMQKGSEVWAIIKINTGSTEELNQIKGEISASGDNFDSDISMVSIIKKITLHRSVEIYFDQIGAGTDDMPVNASDLIRFIQKYAVHKEDYSTPMYSFVTDYSTLANFPRNSDPPTSSEIESDLDYISNRRNDLMLWKTNVDYIFVNPTEFESFNEQELRSTYAIVNLQLRTLSKSLRLCLDVTHVCNTPNLDVQLLELPQRKKNLPPLSCSLERSSVCGVEQFFEKESPYCPNPTYKLSSGPQCGDPQGYENTPHEACGVELYNLGRGDNECGAVQYFTRAGHECGPRRECVASLVVSVGGVSIVSAEAAAAACIARADFETCSHPNFGIQKDNLCRHQNFGIESWATCVDYKHPIFPTCRHSEFGVEKYGTCRLESNGAETFKECLIQKIKEQKLRKCPYIE